MPYQTVILRLQGWIPFNLRLYHSDEWWWCCILFWNWKAVDWGSVHSYGWNNGAALELAKLVVKVKHMRTLSFDLQSRQHQEIMITSTCVWVDNTATVHLQLLQEMTQHTKLWSIRQSSLIFFKSVYSEFESERSSWSRISGQTRTIRISWLSNHW